MLSEFILILTLMAQTPRNHQPEQPVAVEQGLPANIDAERAVLGSVLLDDRRWSDVEKLPVEAFFIEKHRRIYRSMVDLRAVGECVDRMTVAHELAKRGQLESVDGLAYLVSLDAGLPELINIASYVRIVGRMYALRQLVFQGQEVINRAMNAVESADDIAGGTIESIQKIQGELQTGDGGRSPTEVLDNYPGGMNAFLDPSQQIQGLPTGFRKFDEMICGMHGDELIILAARPSHGKTALAMQIASHVAISKAKPEPVAVFSLEMNAASLIKRMACSNMRIDHQKYRHGFLNADERKRLTLGVHTIAEAPLTFYDNGPFDAPTICTTIRRLVAKGRCSLVVVDYLQLMDGRGENQNLKMAAITRAFKLLTKECNVPMLLLSQLSRRNEQRPGGSTKPILSDLRDSGAIEQDADTVAFIYREELYKRDREDIRGLADLIVAKQRNGPIGEIPLRFLGQFVRFENKAEDLEEGNIQ